MITAVAPDIAIPDARALVRESTALHDAEDLVTLARLLRTCTAGLIPFDAIEIVGGMAEPWDRGAVLAMPHRLAIRTPGGGPALIGLVLGRHDRPFSSREVALAALLGPFLGAAADHVRLRAAARARLRDLPGLTEREREVLALVADGRTNRDIGQALFIECRTVEKHVEHIRMKLGARSRAEAAARFARATA